MLSLVDVFVLEPAVWRELNAACVGAGRPRPGAAGGARLLRRDRRRADRDDALRAGAARAVRPALRPARRRDRRLRAAAAGRGARRERHPARRVRRRHRRRQQGRPLAQVARRDDRGVRDLPRAARRRAPLPAHRAPRARTRGRTCRRCSTSSASPRRPCSSSTRAATSSTRSRPEEMAGDLRVARRAPERVDGRGLRAHRARGAGVRRARDRHRLHRDERGLRRRLEGRLRAATGPTRPRGRRGRTSRRSSRASRRATRARRASRGASSPPAPASTRSPTTPTACWPSTGCRRSSEVALRLPGVAPPLTRFLAVAGVVRRRSSAPPAA